MPRRTRTVAALSGQSGEAVLLHREALRSFRELGLVFIGAQTAIEMATVLDPALPEVSEAVDSARATLARLRAKAYLDQLDAATQWSTRETTSV